MTEDDAKDGLMRPMSPTLSNYQRAMKANKDGLLETIDRLDREIEKIERAIGDFETTRECLVKAKSYMLEHVRTYEAEIAKG